MTTHVGLNLSGSICRLCKKGRLSFDERTRFYALHCWRCDACGELFYDNTVYRPVTSAGIAYVRIKNRNVRVHRAQE